MSYNVSILYNMRILYLHQSAGSLYSLMREICKVAEKLHGKLVDNFSHK